ncbi:hypothetical protein NKH37_33725 [Mesorhizobium sp. M1217]|uniref:hypothetical protein n=1 Tax=Mesorhizobium sp. M1217 TaxID=2957070 RepID=UPI00333A3DB9
MEILLPRKAWDFEDGCCRHSSCGGFDPGFVGQMAGTLRQQLIAEAEALAAAKDPEITVEDRRRPVFTPIQDLEHVLSGSSEQEVLETFYAAIEDKYLGWGLLQIRRENHPERMPLKTTTFSLGELLPWWQDLADEAPAAD